MKPVDRDSLSSLVLPRPELIIHPNLDDVYRAIADVEGVVDEEASRPCRNSKAGVVQLYIIVFDSRRQVTPKSPLNTRTGDPAVVAGASGPGKRCARRRVGNRIVATPDPGPTALAIHKHTIKTITEAAGHIGQLPVVAGHLNGITASRWHNSSVTVAGIGKPVEVSLDAEKHAAPELVVKPDLAAAGELALVGRIIVIQTEAVGDANGVPAPSNVGADI